MQSRDDAEKNSCDHTEQDGKNQHRNVEARFGESRNGAGTKSAQRREQGRGQRHADRATEERKQKAFAEELTDEPATRCTDGFAQGHLALARSGAREQKIRNIGAGDQQDEAHGREQHRETGAQRADQAFREGLRGDADFSGIYEAVKLALIAGVDGVEFGLCGGERFTGAQAPKQTQIAGSGANLFRTQERRIGNSGHPDIRLGKLQRETKAGRENADNGHRFTIDSHGATERAGIGSEMAVPETIGDDGHACGAGGFFFRTKIAAVQRRNAEDAE